MHTPLRPIPQTNHRSISRAEDGYRVGDEICFPRALTYILQAQRRLSRKLGDELKGSPGVNSVLVTFNFSQANGPANHCKSATCLPQKFSFLNPETCRRTSHRQA